MFFSDSKFIVNLNLLIVYALIKFRITSIGFEIWGTVILRSTFSKTTLSKMSWDNLILYHLKMNNYQLTM